MFVQYWLVYEGLDDQNTMKTSRLKHFTMEKNVQPPETMYSFVYTDVVDETLNLVSQAVYKRNILISPVYEANIVTLVAWSCNLGIHILKTSTEMEFYISLDKNQESYMNK